MAVEETECQREDSRPERGQRAVEGTEGWIRYIGGPERGQRAGEGTWEGHRGPEKEHRRAVEGT